MSLIDQDFIEKVEDLDSKQEIIRKLDKKVFTMNMFQSRFNNSLFVNDNSRLNSYDLADLILKRKEDIEIMRYLEEENKLNYFIQSPYISNTVLNYGNQDIFNQYTFLAINMIRYLIQQDFDILKIIRYMGYERYNLSASQKNFNNFGFFYYKNLQTPLLTYRYINMADFVKRIFAEFGENSFDQVNEIFFEGNNFKISRFGTIPNIPGDILEIRLLDPEKNILTTTRINIFHLDSDPETVIEKSLAENSKNYINFNFGLFTRDDINLNFWQTMIELFEEYKFLLENGDRYSLLDKIAEIHWYFAVLTPYQRGGGSISEWLASAMMLEAGINFKGWSDNPFLEPWSQAISSGVERFKEIYPDLFSEEII